MNCLDKSNNIIANLISDNFRYGNSPKWSLCLSNIDYSKLSDNTLEYIVNRIKRGFTQGEIFEDEIEGWWQLKMDMS